jgi:hypothetical protein
LSLTKTLAIFLPAPRLNLPFSVKQWRPFSLTRSLAATRRSQCAAAGYSFRIPILCSSRDNTYICLFCFFTVLVYVNVYI